MVGKDVLEYLKKLSPEQLALPLADFGVLEDGTPAVSFDVQFRMVGVHCGECPQTHNVLAIIPMEVIEEFEDRKPSLRYLPGGKL